MLMVRFESQFRPLWSPAKNLRARGKPPQPQLQFTHYGIIDPERIRLLPDINGCIRFQIPSFAGDVGVLRLSCVLRVERKRNPAGRFGCWHSNFITILSVKICVYPRHLRSIHWVYWHNCTPFTIFELDPKEGKEKRMNRYKTRLRYHQVQLRLPPVHAPWRIS